MKIKKIDQSSTKKNELWVSVLGALFFCFATDVKASGTMNSVLLIPTTPITELVNGDIVEFEVYIEFSLEGGAGTLGGGFDVVFDPDGIQFFSLTSGNLGDPDFGRNPDILRGLLESWSVGSFIGLAGSGPELVGTVGFRVLPTMPENSLIEVTPTNGIGGPWFSANDFVTILSVDYNQLTLQRVQSDRIFMNGFEAL